MDALLTQIGWAVYDYLYCTRDLREMALTLAAFDQRALDASRAGDGRAERLLGQITALLAEYSAGHRDTESLMAELRAACRDVPRGNFTVSTAVSQNATAVLG